VGLRQSYINERSALNSSMHDWEAGAWAHHDDASTDARKRYLKSRFKSTPILGNEYDYIVGPVLLRISGHLTGPQARAYRIALRGIMNP